MNVELRPVELPDFGVPEARPAIAAAEHNARMDALQAAADDDWVVVYGDREHFANLAFLCGFDPRFEEALLLLGPSMRTLVVGLEGEAYASLLAAALDVVVCPSLSLMGQDRTGGPTLEAVLRDAGIARRREHRRRRLEGARGRRVGPSHPRPGRARVPRRPAPPHRRPRGRPRRDRAADLADRGAARAQLRRADRGLRVGGRALLDRGPRDPRRRRPGRDRAGGGGVRCATRASR